MKETKNIKLVAYLRFIGIYPDTVEVVSRGRAKYHFKMDSKTWLQYKQEFDKSDFIKYAACIDAVVDLAY